MSFLDKLRLKIKEPANALTHFAMFLAGLVFLALLLKKGWGRVDGTVVGLIFGLSIILLYGASTLYHWIRTTPKKELLLRKLDHISIYVLIAGTYTPVLYYALEGRWRWITLAAVWTLASIGSVLKIWFVNLPRALTAVFYLCLGWFAVLLLPQLVRVLPKPALIMLIAGGLVYTFGAIVYATKICNFVPKRFGFHEMFHIFVGLGTVLHFLMIYLYII